jgi:integrase
MEITVTDVESYTAILLREFIPNEIHATRLDGSSPWQFGQNRSLLHDHWDLRPETVGRLLVRETAIARFDLPVGEYGLRLNHPTLIKDCLTAKIFCCRSLAMPIKRRKVTPLKSVDNVNAFAWIVRWKIDNGLDTFRELRLSDFHTFLDRLASNDLLELVDIEPRVERLFKDVEKGEFDVTRVNQRGHIVYDKEKVAYRLGVTVRSMGRSDDFTSLFQDNVAGLPTDGSNFLRQLPAKPFSKKLVGDRAEMQTAGLNDDVDESALDLAESAKKENTDEAQATSKRGARTIFTYLSVWETLSRLSAAGAFPYDPLTFDPFEDEDKKTLQARYGVEAGRTPNLFPPDFFRVMKVATEWALAYGDYIAEAAELLRNNPSSSDRGGRSNRDRLRDEVDAKRPEGAPYLAMHWSAKPHAVSDDVQRLPMGKAVKFLLASCAMLIAGFSARRLTEFMSLKSNCVEESRPGVFNLSVYIEKTFQEYDRIPVPAMIKTVVQLLERLSGSAREENGTDWIFQVKHANEATKRPFIHFNFRAAVSEFLEFIQLDPPSGQRKWRVSAHQFRRGYAILYYHGFVLSKFDSIQIMLRHFDPSMSQIYIHDILVGNLGRLRQEIAARRRRSIESMSEEEQIWLRQAKDMLDELVARHRDFEEVRCDAVAHKLLDYWDRQQEAHSEEQRFENRISGFGAPALLSALQSMEEKARKSVRVTSRANSPGAIREPLYKLVRQWVKDNYLTPVPGYATYCRAKPGHKPHIEKAECLKRKAAHSRPWQSPVGKNDNLPDYSFTSEFACFVCELGVRFADNRVVVEEHASNLDLIAEKSLPSMQESHQAKAARYKQKIFETDQIRIKK